MEGFIAMRLFFIWASALLFVSATQYQNHYPFESDTILTAWLIRTYVDKNATFKSFPKTVTLKKEVAINTPNAYFRRNAKYTAYEMAKRKYHISDTCSNSLVKVIKVLEMMPWKKHEYEDILAFEEGLVPLFPKQAGDANLTKVFHYIDQYCKEHE